MLDLVDALLEHFYYILLGIIFGFVYIKPKRVLKYIIFVKVLRGVKFKAPALGARARRLLLTRSPLHGSLPDLVSRETNSNVGCGDDNGDSGGLLSKLTKAKGF